MCNVFVWSPCRAFTLQKPLKSNVSSAGARRLLGLAIDLAYRPKDGMRLLITNSLEPKLLRLDLIFAYKALLGSIE